MKSLETSRTFGSLVGSVRDIIFTNLFYLQRIFGKLCQQRVTEGQLASKLTTSSSLKIGLQKAPKGNSCPNHQCSGAMFRG